MPNENVVAFRTLDPSRHSDVEIAVGPNPDPADVAGLPNLALVQSLWAGVERLVHGTRLFYELLSCGEPCGRMGRGGWPAMRSRHQEMASLCAASRIFLSRSKPTRKID